MERHNELDEEENKKISSLKEVKEELEGQAERMEEVEVERKIAGEKKKDFRGKLEELKREEEEKLQEQKIETYMGL